MENQIQPQPYWADFKIKVGLYAKQEENGETKRVLIDPKDIQFKFTYKDSKDNQLVASYDGTTRVNHKIEDNHIIVIVNSNTFQCGILRVTRGLFSRVSDFFYGIWDYGVFSEFWIIEFVS